MSEKRKRMPIFGLTPSNESGVIKMDSRIRRVCDAVTALAIIIAAVTAIIISMVIAWSVSAISGKGFEP